MKFESINNQLKSVFESYDPIWQSLSWFSQKKETKSSTTELWNAINPLTPKISQVILLTVY